MGMKLPIFRRKSPKRVKKAVKEVTGVKKSEKPFHGFLKTKIPDFDDLFKRDIPKGASVIVSGGPSTWRMRGERHSSRLAEFLITKQGLVVLPISKKTDVLTKRIRGVAKSLSPHRGSVGSISL